MKRITVRIALIRLRRKRRNREVNLEAAAVSGEAHAIGDHAELQLAVAALPNHLRAVLVLKEIEGYSHGEIGELLGISAGASRVRLLRAIRRLRNTLGSER